MEPFLSLVKPHSRTPNDCIHKCKGECIDLEILFLRTRLFSGNFDDSLSLSPSLSLSQSLMRCLSLIPRSGVSDAL